VNSSCVLLLLFVEEAEAVAVAEAGALRIRPGGSHWRAWSSFRYHPQNHYK